MAKQAHDSTRLRLHIAKYTKLADAMFHKKAAEFLKKLQSFYGQTSTW